MNASAFNRAKKTAVVLSVAAMIAAISLGALRHSRHRALDDSPPPAFELELPVIPSQPVFFEESNFRQALEKAACVKPRSDIRAIIVPQHLLASSLIAEQIKRASGNKIDTVVIVGPNHFNVGPERIAAARACWQTALGETCSDSDLTRRFLSDLELLNDAGVFKNEHSVGAVAPFVKEYFPAATILPVAFNSYATLEDAERVSAWMAKNLPEERGLIIYSIDFSHYLPKKEADKKDIETKDLIERGAVSRIMTLGNDYLDSPASLATALLYADKKDLKTNILSIMNSDDFSIERTDETTSYFTIIFTK
jgi:AmmeMemoRadiSam system protein B